MTFLDREQSNYDGQPIYLYEFRRGTMRALYASSDRDITTSVGTFTAKAISNGGVTFKGMAATDQFEITAPTDIDIGAWFAYTPPSDTVYLVLRRFHWGDPHPAIVYVGQLVSVTVQGDDTLSIKCQPTSISLKRSGLRATWQRGCIHGLYDQNCQAAKSAFALAATIALVLPASFTTVQNLNNGYWWPGGIIEWEVQSGTFERRLIEGVNTSTHEIVPFGQLDGFTPGLAITLYPGCKRTSAWCDAFFNNLANYGGFQYMPNRTPYDGDTVF